MATTRLRITRGRDAEWTITVTDNSGVVVDLTGAAAYFTVRKSFSSGADDSDAIFQISVASGITFTNPTAGVLKLVIAAALTRNVSATSYICDLTLFLSGGKEITPTIGTLAVDPDVTRRTS